MLTTSKHPVPDRLKESPFGEQSRGLGGVRIRNAESGCIAKPPQTSMEAPRTFLEDLVPFTEAFWELQ